MLLQLGAADDGGVTSRGPEDRDRRITSHLLADLANEARDVWASTAPPEPSRRRRGLHDTVHARLSGVTRSLRATKLGLPVHAGACVLAGGPGVLIGGPTGSGKSSLSALFATEWEATLVSDDTVWLGASGAEGIGAPVALRPGSPLWARARGLWHADDSARLLARTVDLDAPPVALAGPVDRVLFPMHRQDMSQLTPLPAAEAFGRLVGSVLRRCSEGDLVLLAELVGRCPAAAIAYPDAETSLQLSATWLEAATVVPRVEVQVLDVEVLRGAGLGVEVRGVRFDDDVVLWRPELGRLLHLRGWLGGSLCNTPAWEELTASGFVGHQEDRKDARPSGA